MLPTLNPTQLSGCRAITWTLVCLAGGSSAAISARAMGPGDWFNEYGDEVWPLPLFPRDQGGYPFEVLLHLDREKQ